MSDIKQKHILTLLALTLAVSMVVFTTGCTKRETSISTSTNKYDYTDYADHDYNYYVVLADEYQCDNLHKHDSACFDSEGNIICKTPDKLVKGDVFFYLRGVYYYSESDGRWLLYNRKKTGLMILDDVQDGYIRKLDFSEVEDYGVPLWCIDNTQKVHMDNEYVETYLEDTYSE